MLKINEKITGIKLTPFRFEIETDKFVYNIELNTMNRLTNARSRITKPKYEINAYIGSTLEEIQSIRIGTLSQKLILTTSMGVIELFFNSKELVNYYLQRKEKETGDNQHILKF